MLNQKKIHYLNASDIDKEKWDRCIDNATNGLIYAYSYYLDAMARNWDALVTFKEDLTENEYEAVMPLTWNKKYTIQYLYQPFLTAELGVFGSRIEGDVVVEFVKAIPTKFRLVEIALNSGQIPGLASRHARMRKNYLLSLDKPYEKLYGNYRENTQRNIKKATQAGVSIEKGFAVDKVIDLALKQMEDYGMESDDNVTRFRKLYPLLKERGMATTYGVALKDQLLASCVFFFSHNRAYYILVGNHPVGKSIGASHALIDAFIKDHANKDMILDFEGSDISSLALFYASFGAIETLYTQIRMNRLPFYLKWFKR